VSVTLLSSSLVAIAENPRISYLPTSQLRPRPSKPSMNWLTWPACTRYAFPAGQCDRRIYSGAQSLLSRCWCAGASSTIPCTGLLPRKVARSVPVGTRSAGMTGRHARSPAEHDEIFPRMSTSRSYVNIQSLPTSVKRIRAWCRLTRQNQSKFALVVERVSSACSTPGNRENSCPWRVRRRNGRERARFRL